jgi:hypothetical protein
MTSAQRKAVIDTRRRRLRERMDTEAACARELLDILSPDVDEHPIAVHREIVADVGNWARNAATVRYERLVADRVAEATAEAQGAPVTITRDPTRPDLPALTDDEVRARLRDYLINERTSGLHAAGPMRSPVFDTYLDVVRAAFDPSTPAPASVIECLDVERIKTLQRDRGVELRAQHASDRQAATAAATEFAYLPKAWRLSEESLRKSIATATSRG